MTADRQVESGAGTRLAHQPGLDGVRALAVLAVLAYHDGRLRGGFLGVSTFFTLSGFLITGLLLAEWHTRGRVSFRDFYARRLRRLAPAAVLGLVLAAAITTALRAPSVSHAFRGDAFSALFDVANWRFLAGGRSYGAQFTTPSPVLHFWSLAVEEQFYLVLVPVLVGLFAPLARGRRRLVGAIVALLAVASFVDGWVAASGGSVNRAYYGTDTRAVEFLVGALLALALARYRSGDAQLSRTASRIAAGLGLPAIAFLAWMNTRAQPQDASLFRGGLLVYAVAGAALLVAVCEPGPLRWLCSRAPLRGLGLISYGVYVLHWPLFLWLSPARTGLSPAALTAVRLGTTIVLAAVSYRYIESPIRNRRWTLAGWKLDRRPWAVATAGVMAVAVASVAVAVTEPALAVDFAPVRSRAAVLAAAGAAVPVSTRTGHASRKLERIVVTGDSVGLTLGRGIERWGASKGITVLNAGSLGCTLMGGDLARTYSGVSVHPSDPCDTRETWPVVLRKFRPDLVVALFGAWDVYDLSWDGGNTWSAAGQPVFDAHYLATMRDASTRLAAYGARVLWLAPPCFAYQAGDSGSPASPWYAPGRVAALGEMLHTVARETHASWSDVVHRAGCPVNFATRPDGVHYSDAGADAIMPALGPVIMRAGEAHG